MKKKSSLLRVVILLILGALIYIGARAAGIIDGLPKFEWSLENIVRGALILIALLVFEGLVSFLLGAIRPKRHRTRTMVALIKNITRYAVILISICVVLTMLNVDIVTILSGLGIVALIQLRYEKHPEPFGQRLQGGYGIPDPL